MIERILLGGQFLVVALTWIFVWRVMRAAHRSLAAPDGAQAFMATSQDSTILSPTDVARARRESGIAPPRLVVVTGDGLRAGQPFAIVDTALRVGRAPDNDIVLSDEYASSHHCEVTTLGRITDLGSTNGTLVNGTRLTAPQTLRPGDVIAIGGTQLRFEVSE